LDGKNIRPKKTRYKYKFRIYILLEQLISAKNWSKPGNNKTNKKTVEDKQLHSDIKVFETKKNADQNGTTP